MKERLISWLITTGISLALFLIGFYGQIAVKGSPVMKISTERIQLNGDIPKLAEKSFEYLKPRAFLSGEIREKAASLETNLEKLKADLEQTPLGEQGKAARGKLRTEIGALENDLQTVRKNAVEDYLNVTAADQIPQSFIDYREKTTRLKEIENMGWVYSHKTSVAVFLLGFLCAVTMCAGMLGLFLFGILGLLTFIGSTK